MLIDGVVFRVVGWIVVFVTPVTWSEHSPTNVQCNTRSGHEPG